MDLLLLLMYAGLCVVIFKVFKIPLNKWTVPTAILGGIVMLASLLTIMNFNHPYAKYAREFYVSVPIVPAVKGIVVSVDAQPNAMLKKGDVLFQIDPKPYQLKVDKKRAQLADAEQQVKQSLAQLEGATARVAKAKADRDRSKQSYERYRKGSKNEAVVFSKQEVENRRQLYLASEAALDAAEAEQRRTKLVYESEIGGVNTRVAQLQSELASAEYDFDRTTVRAPSDGYVTQVALRPAVMATALPLRPAMVFIPQQRRQIVGSFWQNSLQRMKPGFKAEVVLDAIPGHVFSGSMSHVLPAMSEGDIQSSGTLVAASRVATHGRALAVINLDEDLDSYDLPRGLQGKAIIISDSDPLHVSMIRRILLRMMGWLNYLFPIKG